MDVELLYSPGCPNLEPTRVLLADVLRQAGLDVAVRETAVWDPDEATRLRFPGSPTIRVNGVDIDPNLEGERHASIRCRLYGASGVPPRALLESALRTRTSA